MTTALPCTQGCARSAGNAQIASAGVSPLDWLSRFGHSVNAGANGDRGTPLALLGPEERHWRLRVEVLRAEGVPAAKWAGVYVQGGIASERAALPERK